jgi:hypothetical protein
MAVPQGETPKKRGDHRDEGPLGRMHCAEAQGLRKLRISVKSVFSGTLGARPLRRGVISW